MTSSSHAVSPQSQRVADIFTRAAMTYESVGVNWFVPIAHGLIDVVDISPGDRVLDIG